MPRRSSSAGACSRNRPASSTLSSSDDGSCVAARSAATSTDPAERQGQLGRRRRPARGPALAPASSTASGVASQTSSAVHQRPGSSSSTTSRRTSQSSNRSSGTSRRTRGTTTGSPSTRRWWRSKRVASSCDLVGWATALPLISGSGDASARNTARAATVAGARAVRERRAPALRRRGGCGPRRRPARRGCRRPSSVVGHGQADRRHRRRELGEGGVEHGIVERHPAGHGQVAVGADARRDQPGGDGARAAAATAASQATESPIAAPGCTEEATWRHARRGCGPTPGGRCGRRGGRRRRWRSGHDAAG